MQLQSSQSMPDTATAVNPVEALQKWLVAQLASQLSLDPSTIKVNEPLTRYGLDSIDAVTLVGDLEDWLDLELPDTLFWDHPSIAQASTFLAENYDLAEALSNTDAPEAAAPAPTAEQKAPEEKKGWGNLLGRFK